MVLPIFHRLSANPSGYDTVPTGYDFINNPSANGDPGNPALIDTKKGSGPNQGTYFFGFGEDVVSAALNRGVEALAQNTDYLDEKIRRPIAILTVSTGTSVGALTSLALPAGTYVGTVTDTVGKSLESLFQLVDTQDNEMLDSAGARLHVASISGASIGDGFADSGVTLHFSGLGVPTSTEWKLYYLTKNNFGAAPRDMMSSFQPRASVRTGGEVIETFSNLHGGGAYGQDISWTASWASTIWDLTQRGLNGVYSNMTEIPGDEPPEDYFPLVTVADAAGAGGWYSRVGPAMTAYANSATSSANRYYDPIDGLWVAKARDAVGAGSAGGGATGFVFYGTRRTHNLSVENPYYSPYASFLQMEANGGTGALSDNTLTKLSANASIQIYTSGVNACVELTNVGHYFAKAISGSSTAYNTAVACGTDMLEIVWDDGSGLKPHMYLVAGLIGNKTAVVRELNGGAPAFPGTPLFLATGLREWHRMSMGVGAGSLAYYDLNDSGTWSRTPAWLDGFMYTQLTYNTYGTTEASIGVTEKSLSTGVRRAPARFFGPNNIDSAPVLEWGGFISGFDGGGTGMPTYALMGSLGADGSIDAGGSIHSSKGISCDESLVISGGIACDGSVVAQSHVTHTDFLFVAGSVRDVVCALDMSRSATASIMHLQLEANSSTSPFGTVTVNITNAVRGQTYVIYVERQLGDKRATFNLVMSTVGHSHDVLIELDAIDAQLTYLSPTLLGTSAATFDVYTVEVESWRNSTNNAKACVSVRRSVDTYGATT